MRDNYLNYSVQLAITLLLPVERENLFCNNNIIIVVSTSLTGNRSSHTKFAGVWEITEQANDEAGLHFLY